MRRLCVLLAFHALLPLMAGKVEAQGWQIGWVRIPAASGSRQIELAIEKAVKDAPEIEPAEMQRYTEEWTRQLRGDSEAWQQGDYTLKESYLNEWNALSILRTRWLNRKFELDRLENEMKAIQGQLKPLEDRILANRTRQDAERNKLAARLKDIPLQIMLAGKVFVGGEERPSDVLPVLKDLMRKQAAAEVNGQLVRAKEVVVGGTVTQETQSLVTGRVEPFTGIPFVMTERGEEKGSSTYYLVQIFEVYPKIQDPKFQDQDKGKGTPAPEDRRAKSVIMLRGANYEKDLTRFYPGSDSDVIAFVARWLPSLDGRNAKALTDIAQARAEFQTKMAGYAKSLAAAQAEFDAKQCEVLLLKQDLDPLSESEQARGRKCKGYDPNRIHARDVLRTQRNVLWPKQTAEFVNAQKRYREHFSSRTQRFMKVEYGQAERSVVQEQVDSAIKSYKELVASAAGQDYAEELLIIDDQVKQNRTERVTYSATPSRFAVLFVARQQEQKRVVPVVGLGVEVTLRPTSSLGELSLPTAPEFEREQCTVTMIRTLLNLRVPLNKIAVQCNINE